MASDSELGGLAGYVQSILDNTNPSGSPITNIWSYMNQGGFGQNGMAQLLAMLQGNQQRDLGLAGRQAGASAAAYGLNPSSAIQRAQSPIYGDYAKQFANLPMLQAQLKGMNFDVLMRLLGMKQGIAGQRSGGAADFVPGLIEGAGKIGAAALMG